MVSLAGCTQHERDDGALIDAPPEHVAIDATGDTSRAPGVYATIIGSAFAGTYALTQTVVCNQDIETHAYRAFGGNHGEDADISVFSRALPAAGTTYASPDFWVNLYEYGVADTGSYPQHGDTGGCTVTIERGWPQLRAQFSCTNLKAADHSTFEIRDGVVVCP